TMVVRSASLKISRSSTESSSSATKESMVSAVETRIPLFRRMLANSRIFFSTAGLALVQGALLGGGGSRRGAGRLGRRLARLLLEQLVELGLRLPHVAL